MEEKGGEGRECCGVQNFLKIHPASCLRVLLKGAIPYSEPSLLSTIALFRLMIKAWKPVFIESRFAKISNYSE